MSFGSLEKIICNAFLWRASARMIVFIEFSPRISSYDMLYVIWHHLYNLINVKNTLRGVLLVVSLQAKACNFTKSNLLRECFSRFLNCTNSTKLLKASHMKYLSLWIFQYVRSSQVVVYKKRFKKEKLTLSWWRPASYRN